MMLTVSPVVATYPVMPTLTGNLLWPVPVPELEPGVVELPLSMAARSTGLPESARSVW